LIFFALSSAVLAGGAVAQGSGRPTAAVHRSDLEAQARVADSLHRSEEAFAIRRRLRDGDFEVGDRIFLVVESAAQGSAIPGLSERDTLVVQAGRVLQLPPPIETVNLTGVLFSELTDTVNAHISKYFRNVVVRATPLLRLSITGAVQRPGFYYVPADSPINDLFTRSGGQTGLADLSKTEIHRGSTVLWKSNDVQVALTDGMTVQSLGLLPGDELIVGEKKQRNWMAVAQIGATAITLLIALTQLTK
jgi:protein involved in polysaccharide export with SLBB domain